MKQSMSEYKRAGSDDLLNQLLNSAVEEVHAKEGSILLISDDGESLEFVLSVSVSSDKLIGLKQPLNKGISGLAFTLQQPMIVNDVSQDAAFDASVDDQSNVRTESIIVIPLVSPDAEFGVLTGINSTKGAFSHPDMEVYSKAATGIIARLTELNLSLPAPNDGYFE